MQLGLELNNLTIPSYLTKIRHYLGIVLEYSVYYKKTCTSMSRASTTTPTIIVSQTVHVLK